MSDSTGNGNSNTPPGWFPDGEGKMRWWDGSAWTDRVQEPGTTETGNLASAPSQVQASSAQPSSPDAAVSRPWYKKKRYWIIAAVAVIVIAIAGGSGGGSDDTPAATDKSDSKSADSSPSDDASKAAKEKAEKAAEKVKAAKEKAEKAAAKAKAAKAKAKAEKPIAVNAADIVQEFEDNELAADSKYKGKNLKVTGVVGKIDTELFEDDKYYVEIGGGDEYEFLMVNCHDMSKDELATLNKGDNVTVVGKFDDGGDLGVEVKDCKLA